MDTFYEIKPRLLEKSSLALGFFDGVHPGHEVVIRKAVEEAERLGAVPGVVTFKEHPRALTLGKSPSLLTLIDQRLELFAELGIKAALVLSFTEELCRLAPEDYVQSVLVECMGAKSLSVGFNHRFGRNRVGDPELLRELGQQFGYIVHVAGPIFVDELEVSSSRIREAVKSGDVAAAEHLLARPYAIQGSVMKGDGRGRGLGFPTANLDVPEEQVMPAPGVYAAVARLEDGSAHPAVVNIGYRPTFGDSSALTTEVHILSFDQSLYDQKLVVAFVKRIRAEQKFSGVEQLKEQIGKDCNTACSYFEKHPEILQSKTPLCR